MSTLLEKINQAEKLDDEIRDYLYPKLFKLYDEKKINNGDLPKKSAKDALYISSYSFEDNKINVSVDVYWGYCGYDHTRVSFTNEEWELI